MQLDCFSPHGIGTVQGNISLQMNSTSQANFFRGSNLGNTMQHSFTHFIQKLVVVRNI